MTVVTHNRPARWLLVTGVACGALLTGFRNHAPTPAASPAGLAIQQELRAFRVFGTVLHVGAHPDDENTVLVTYLAKGRALRAAYLSVTRGDGGQNLIGGELGEKLGVARTQELLAARRIDGARQFFTTALDFGYSKDVKEALSTWDHQQVLSDVVRVIRTFRPDVIVTVFSPEPSNTHGHHTASAVLALEAFKLAGDPKAFPDQLTYLKPWQPKRIFQGGGSGPVRVDLGGNDPATGESFASIAGRSRAMHKTQGFGQGGGAGGGGRGGGQQAVTLLAGDPATNDIMDGIDTTWNRIPGGAEIGAEASEILSRFNANDPSAMVGDLLNLRKHVVALAEKVNDPIVTEKRQLLEHIIMECVGLHVQTVMPLAEVVPGESFTMTHKLALDSKIPVRWLGVRYPGEMAIVAGPPIALTPGGVANRAATKTLAAHTPLSQPYWLRHEPTAGNFKVDDPTLIGRPENPPAYPLVMEFEIGGQTISIPDEPVQISACTSNCPPPRHFDVIAPVALAFSPEVGVFSPGVAHTVTVSVTAARANTSGMLRLNTPAGWRVAPASHPFKLVKAQDSLSFTFSVVSPGIATATILAEAQVGGATYDTRRIAVDYAHIPLQLLQPVARLHAVSLNLATRGHKVGYVPGAGDDVASAIREMGYDVTMLNSAADMTPEKLHGLDAVVLGIRVFNVRTDLATVMPLLFKYAEDGGNVIVQYSQNGGTKSTQFAPYPLQLSTLRVTDEHAPVTFLAPDHPALNSPNKITASDFTGWIQEEGIYYPSTWDSHFTPIIASHDAGEAPLNGGLLVAPVGKGNWVYTGLVFFRELPAGVPGAFRLFANLLALGKPAPRP